MSTWWILSSGFMVFFEPGFWPGSWGFGVSCGCMVCVQGLWVYGSSGGSCSLGIGIPLVFM